MDAIKQGINKINQVFDQAIETAQNSDLFEDILHSQSTEKSTAIATTTTDTIEEAVVKIETPVIKHRLQYYNSYYDYKSNIYLQRSLYTLVKALELDLEENGFLIRNSWKRLDAIKKKAFKLGLNCTINESKWMLDQLVEFNGLYDALVKDGAVYDEECYCLKLSDDIISTFKHTPNFSQLKVPNEVVAYQAFYELSKRCPDSTVYVGTVKTENGENDLPTYKVNDSVGVTYITSGEHSECVKISYGDIAGPNSVLGLPILRKILDDLMLEGHLTESGYAVMFSVALSGTKEDKVELLKYIAAAEQLSPSIYRKLLKRYTYLAEQSLGWASHLDQVKDSDIKDEDTDDTFVKV